MGPLAKCGHYFTYTSIGFIAMIVIVFILSCLCVSFACCKEDNILGYIYSKHRNRQTRLFFFVLCFSIVFLLILSVDSVFIFMKYHEFSIFGDCNGSQGLLYGLYVWYVLVLYFIIGWCVVVCKAFICGEEYKFTFFFRYTETVSPA